MQILHKPHAAVPHSTRAPRNFLLATCNSTEATSSRGSAHLLWSNITTIYLDLQASHLMPVSITMGLRVALLLYCAAVIAMAHSPRQGSAHGIRDPSSASNVTIWNDELNGTSSSVSKRWFSVPELPTAGIMQVPYVYPWPRTCSTPVKRPVRYCYLNARSARNLAPLVQVAQAAWAAAMVNPEGQVSSLSLEPDSGCPRDENGQLMPDCICTGRVNRDALVISDETIDGDEGWNDSPMCETSTTLGYEYISDDEPDRPWRHRLRFCAYEPTHPARSFESASRDLTHEFGHAFGLLHEHQRPDRDTNLIFTCRYVRGWFDVRKEIDADEFGLFEQAGMAGASKDAKMARICSSWTFAEKYFPELADFLRADQFDFNGDIPYQTRMQRTEWSRTFDFDSIMIYDSGMASMDTTQRHWVLRRLDGSEIIMGGTKDEPRITEGDVARIATLYPVDTEQNRNAREGSTGNDWTAVHRLPEDFGSDSDGDDSDDSDAKVKRKVEPRTMTIKIGNSGPVVVRAPLPIQKLSEL
ncbi:hypothetical protein HII31_04316 [Pseudocercospora fuligena]|uniref:Peptidase M12A domain-containing protein n=1 Tax=Pseudocercospora fuligena TaxID=685502 RepID=A0A8H6RNB8_9PEZI|nr:hypothetical protein HII31_04316 [Pseudocercospora fuligena]